MAESSLEYDFLEVDFDVEELPSEIHTMLLNNLDEEHEIILDEDLSAFFEEEMELLTIPSIDEASPVVGAVAAADSSDKAKRSLESLFTCATCSKKYKNKGFYEKHANECTGLKQKIGRKRKLVAKKGIAN